MAFIKVNAVKYGDRKNYVLRWKDPETGLYKTQSSEVSNRRDANAAAQRKEEELNSGTLPADGSIAWETFCSRLNENVQTGLAERTSEKIDGVINVMSQYQKPHQLCDVDSQYLSGYVGWLRRNDREESTIQSHLRHIKTFLRWAVDNHYLRTMPTIPTIPRASKRKMMKGRPITDAEFELFCKQIPGRVDAGHEANWLHMARGLWLSGLRLEESMSLSWDQSAGFHVFFADSGRPQLRIPDWAQKSHEDAIYPITPDFAEFLLAVPEEKRVGWVFMPTFTNHRNGKHERFQNSSDVSREFSAFGQAAKIIVDVGKPKAKGEEPKKKYASAHDLRRSFGDRWSKLVLSFVLKELMRHASITTTEMYYVGNNVDRIQDEVYRVYTEMKKKQQNESGGNSSGNSPEGDSPKTL